MNSLARTSSWRRIPIIWSSHITDFKKKAYPLTREKGNEKWFFTYQLTFELWFPLNIFCNSQRKKIFMNHFTSKYSNGNNEVIGWVILFILCFLLASSFEHSVWQLWKSEFLLENLLLGNIFVLLDFLKRCVI